jgi:hypothetical protein
MSSNTLSLNRFVEVLGLKRTSTSKTKKQIKSKKGLPKEKKGKKGKKSIKQMKNVIIQNPLCDTCIKIKTDKSHPATLLSMNDEDWRNAPNHIPIQHKKLK